MNFIPLNVSLDEACLQEFVRRYHFNDTDKKEIIRLYRQLSPRVHAEFHYVLEGDGAVVVMTLGTAFDELQDSFIQKGDINRAYMVDCLGLEIMSLAYDKIDEKLHELTGKYAGGYVFTGVEELPLSETPRLMALLGQKVVTYNEAYVLLPKKSVLFTVPLYDEKIEKHDKCAYCSAVSCQLRKAEYIGGTGRKKEVEASDERADSKSEAVPGLIHLYTGEGKGKTTAAIGLSVRAAGAGKRVVFAQFMKGRDTSELNILRQIPGIKVVRSDKELGWFKKGDPDSIAAFTEVHNALLDEIESYVYGGDCDLLVLDEVTYPVNYGIIDTDRIERLLNSKPAYMELVLTGRNAPELFTEKADYITEMRKEKHPYDQGIQARRGIEY
ncbi:cob(I)yrinic acid a,c-diamide adenosyltransferase [Butyrivibrio sp. MC2021]|uniref:cob(I)yrinic acid a,c-diamide adenosyltransferase n=1 Tax=Butyrivibrio sp. MC2021 TaxID=1408306 RepID=UPI000B060759|nr:cob(I)yrinic acid a,c-diamide adenosyltransferase [Butyrivibrio sp. MC2021]